MSLIKTNSQTVLTPLELQQITTPSNPSSGWDKLYFKSDNKLYKITSGGAESEIGSSATTINTAYTNLTSDISTTSTSFTTTGVSITLTVGASGIAVIDVTSTLRVDNVGAFGYLRVNRDSATEYINCGAVDVQGTNGRIGINKSFIITGLSATSHTFLLEWQTDAGATLYCLKSASATTYNMSIAGMSW